MLTNLAKILAQRDQQIYLLLAVAAMLAAAVLVVLRFAPPRWRGPALVLTAVLLAFPQAALILQ